jgi:hypothetical protein
MTNAGSPMKLTLSTSSIFASRLFAGFILYCHMAVSVLILSCCGFLAMCSVIVTSMASTIAMLRIVVDQLRRLSRREIYEQLNTHVAHACGLLSIRADAASHRPDNTFLNQSLVADQEKTGASRLPCLGKQQFRGSTQQRENLTFISHLPCPTGNR